MSVGWGYVPMQAPLAPGRQEDIETIHLVTNRASAPSLGDFLAELHSSELLSDITICSEDGQAIPCHKLVLVRWSAPFRRMLCGDMREAREKHITLHGVDGEVLAAFIRFLYTCHCSIATEKLVGLCAMADQYDVTLLQQLCMDAIRAHATNHRCCCLFYKAAKDIQQQEIQQLAWEQLSSNLHSLVQQHDVFVQLEFEEVIRLVGRQGATQQQADAAQAAGAAGMPEPSTSAAAGGTAADAAAAAAAGGGGAGGSWGRLSAVAGAAAEAAGGGAAHGTQPQEAALGDGAALPASRQQDHTAAAAAAVTGADPSQQQQAAAWAVELSAQELASSQLQAGWAQGGHQPARRPEYALFLACMAWLHHPTSPPRQQYRQRLYECFDFNAMRDNELSQMRRNAYVQADPELKEMLLDAFERRCLAHSQQPVYHMGPLPHSSCQP